MKDPNFEQQSGRIGLSLCPSGCVHMRFGMTTVHVPPGAFRSFVEQANELLPLLGAVDRDPVNRRQGYLV
jgi:hypothetical protein